MKLQPDDGPRSSLGIGPGSDDAVGSRRSSLGDSSKGSGSSLGTRREIAGRRPEDSPQECRRLSDWREFKPEFEKWREPLLRKFRRVTSTRTARYWAVPSKIDRRQPIEEEIDCLRLIESEIDRRRSIEEEKGKKKRKRKKKQEGKKEYLARASSSSACRRRPVVARGRFFSRAGGQIEA
ncbi:hypothetical protein BHE74_00053887, partial [Ensete ventricosum]